MRIRNLMTFVKVAQLESFHAAARQLHATQPAVSARIAALENELGVKLFMRDTGGTRLTARGQQLLPYAERLVAISREMRDQVSEGVPDRGTIRVGIADTLASLWLADLLRHWREQFPLVEFEVAIDVSIRLKQQLEDHELDLALMVAQDHSPIISTQPLCSYDQCWVAAPGLLQDEKGSDKKVDQPVSLDWLAEHTILSFPRNTRPWQVLAQLFDGIKSRGPMLHTCSSVESLLKLAKQGLGVTLLPRPLVEPLIAGQALQVLPVEFPIPHLDFCCAWRLDDEQLLPRLLANSCRTVITD